MGRIITDADRRVMTAMGKLQRENSGRPPSIRELAASLGISFAWTRKIIVRLEASGAISRGQNGSSRTATIAIPPRIGNLTLIGIPKQID